MRRSIQVLRRLVQSALLLCFVVNLHAQTITGNINGTVTDPSGAIIPGAKVTAKNTDTNVETSTTSNNDGIYNLRFLQVGHYTVTVVVQGFSDRTFGPFALEANQDAKVDAPMSVAGTTQQVSVESTFAPLLNTENAQLATTLDTTAIANVPLIGQQFVQLTMFVPGAVNTQPAALAGNGSIGVNEGVNNGVSVNGNRQQANNYLLDGIEINETLNNTVGYNPAPMALAQVQITSANANAEFGNVNGGDVDMLLKDGTNQFHGSAYEFISDYLLDANTWANKDSAAITARPSFTQSIFGGTFGGPILHNKLFFFGDYDGGRFHQGGASAVSLLTAKMRTGDFSELLSPTIMGSASKEIQLYDASTTAYTPYNNNQLPIVSPVAKYLFAHPNALPMPNENPKPGTPDQNNYQGPSKSRMYNNQFDVKIDANLTHRDTLMGRWIQSNNGGTTTNPLAISFPAAPVSPVKGIALNEVHTFNASMVNEFRAGYTRIRPEEGTPVDTTGDFGANGNMVVGIPGGNGGRIVGFAAQTPTPGSTSGLTVANGGEYTTMGNSYGGMTFVDNSFTYGDDFTWLKDKHTFKMGAQFLREQSNCFSSGNDGVLGTMAYTGLSTSNPLPGIPGIVTGYSMADFVLDRADYIGQGTYSGPQGLRNWIDAYFVQDDWKVTQTLTLNIGVRYEYDQPMYEVHNKQANVNLVTKQLVLAGTPQAAALGGRALVFPYKGGVMPRVGFSYSISPRLVLRGGYGMQTFMEATGETRRLTINPPNNADNYSTGTAPSPTSPAVFFSAESGFTNPATVNPVLALNARDPHIRPALIGEFSLTTEYQVSNTASLRVGYVGESGQHLVNHNAANQLYAPCVENGVVQTSPSTNAYCIANDPSPFQALVQQSGSVTLTTSNAMMNYNGLQVSFRQRAARGLQYTVNYTYSRAMTNSIGFFGAPDINGANNYAENGYNNHAEYGPTSQDVRHGINGNVVYDLPVGRGRMFGTNMNRVLDEGIGGWKVALTGVGYTGFPVTINNSSNTARTDNKIQRANHLRPLKIVNRSANAWFGTDPSATACASAGIDNGVCAYESPANGTYGTAAVGSERGPGYRDFDASLSKGFNIFREESLQFQVDASNVLNMTSLGNPSNTAGSGTFGQITSARSGPRELQLDLKYVF